MGRFVLKSSLEKLILVFGILFIFIFSISAETVLLQEGGSYRGKVITQNQKTLTIQTKHGKHVISKKEILKVIYKDVSEEEEEKVRNAEIQRLEEEKLTKQRSLELKKQQEEEERLRREREAVEKNKPAPPPPPPPKKQPEVSRVGALARSVVLPGWGQWASGRKFAAIIYPTLFWLPVMQYMRIIASMLLPKENTRATEIHTQIVLSHSPLWEYPIQNYLL